MRGTDRMGLEEHHSRERQGNHDSEREFWTEDGDRLHLLHVQRIRLLLYRHTDQRGQNHRAEREPHFHPSGLPLLEVHHRRVSQPHERDRIFRATASRRPYARNHVGCLQPGSCFRHSRLRTDAGVDELAGTLDRRPIGHERAGGSQNLGRGASTCSSPQVRNRNFLVVHGSSCN